jgi:hypothetical protein
MHASGFMNANHAMLFLSLKQGTAVFIVLMEMFHALQYSKTSPVVNDCFRPEAVIRPA